MANNSDAQPYTSAYKYYAFNERTTSTTNNTTNSQS